MSFCSIRFKLFAFFEVSWQCWPSMRAVTVLAVEGLQDVDLEAAAPAVRFLRTKLIKDRHVDAFGLVLSGPPCFFAGSENQNTTLSNRICGFLEGTFNKPNYRVVGGFGFHFGTPVSAIAEKGPHAPKTCSRSSVSEIL